MMHNDKENNIPSSARFLSGYTASVRDLLNASVFLMHPCIMPWNFRDKRRGGRGRVSSYDTSDRLIDARSAYFVSVTSQRVVVVSGKQPTCACAASASWHSARHQLACLQN